MPTPANILVLAYQRADDAGAKPVTNNSKFVEQIDYVCRYVGNRAIVRLLLACSLAKVHKPSVDIRKPYTEIPDNDTYSGRYYDENYITAFINQYELPCNPTTAFLTPALRNRSITLTPDVNLVGRPPKLYKTALELLDAVHIGNISADELLAETIRRLIIVRDEKRQRMQTLLAGLQATDERIPLSSENIVNLIEQHLRCRNSSRLPVLVIAAAYEAAAEKLGERCLPLESHNAADEQTGTLGDLEISLMSDDNVITSYEMKTRRVTKEDIERSLQKINDTRKRVDNYIFITTEFIEPQVLEYAASMYDKTGGIEFIVLDCIGFIRHYLHLFHRLRMQFLEAYQLLVLAEPESAVSQPLKEAFLALRQAAESVEESQPGWTEQP